MLNLARYNNSCQNPSTGESEDEVLLWLQGQPRWHSEFKDSLSYSKIQSQEKN